MKFNIKNKETDKFVALNNIKNIRVTFYGIKENTKNVQSLGWITSLSNAGERKITIKISGTLDKNNIACKLLQQYSFENFITDYQLYFDNGEVINTKGIILSFEIYCEPNNFDSFSIILDSTGIVNFT